MREKTMQSSEERQSSKSYNHSSMHDGPMLYSTLDLHVMAKIKKIRGCGP